jgi:hypothetical protein
MKIDVDECIKMMLLLLLSTLRLNEVSCKDIHFNTNRCFRLLSYFNMSVRCAQWRF